MRKKPSPTPRTGPTRSPPFPARPDPVSPAQFHPAPGPRPRLLSFPGPPPALPRARPSFSANPASQRLQSDPRPPFTDTAGPPVSHSTTFPSAHRRSPVPPLTGTAHMSALFPATLRARVFFL